MREESVRKRELRPLQKIPDNYKKMVVTLDTALNEDYDGILAKDIMQWLLH